jgi:hypothetical protein
MVEQRSREGKPIGLWYYFPDKETLDIVEVASFKNFDVDVVRRFDRKRGDFFGKRVFTNAGCMVRFADRAAKFRFEESCDRYLNAS